MKKKTLFILLPNLEPGGAEHIVITLLRYFDRSVFEITLIVLDSASGSLRAKVPSDVQLVAMNKRRVRTALPELLALLREKKPDILFSNLSHLNLGLAMCRWWLPRKSALIVRESNVISQNVKLFPFSLLFILLYKFFYRNIDVIICQSTEMADDLRQHYHISSSQIRVVNNPVDIAFLEKRAGELTLARPAKHVFVACGRLHYQKGFDLLLHALSGLNRTDWVLWMIGEGELADKLQALSAELGIADRVSFMGFEENPYPYFKQADLFILSSRFEGMPNVVLEALALNTQVLATPAPGGVTALLSKSNACDLAQDISASALLSALESYFSDKMKRTIEPEVIEPYKVETVTKQYEQVLIDVST